MAAVVDLESDVKTVPGWARAVGVSSGSLRGHCHAAGLPPKLYAYPAADCLRTMSAGTESSPEALVTGHFVTRIGAAFRRHRPPLDPLCAKEVLLWHEIVRDVRAILLEDDHPLQADRLEAASGWVDEETVRELLTDPEATHDGTRLARLLPLAGAASMACAHRERSL
jgi:hypothetical protein